MDRFEMFGDYANKSNSIPLPTDNIDQFLISSDNNNDIDFLFNETLTGLQDLDVPSGYYQEQPQSNNQSPNRSKCHSRQYSGTAIFGFTEHTRDLSINGINNDLYKQPKQLQVPKPIDGKSISPGDLLRGHEDGDGDDEEQDLLNLNFDEKPILLLEQDELEDTQKMIHSSPIKKLSTPGIPQQQYAQTELRGPKQQEYIVTNENPKAYKFPPSPTPTNAFDRNISSSPPAPMPPPHLVNVNSYSAKYLQSLQQSQAEVYVDNIEPLLSDDLTSVKYIPIPIQEPIAYRKQQSQRQQVSPPSSSTSQQQQQQQQQEKLQGNFNFNMFLPPPTPPPHGSPEWNSSPEPPSPSPGKVLGAPYQQISPIRQNLGTNVNFYTPMYYDQQPTQLQQTYDQIKQIQQQQHALQQQLHQSPMYPPPPPQTTMGSSVSSSPIKNFTPNDPSLQLSPLKNQLPNTPKKQPPVTIEWSPVISPNSKQPLHKQLKETAPRRRIKKTSLLPPGELDNYWTGPDENKIFTCTYKNCFKKFTRRYNVRSHIQTHLSDRPFGCTFCPKRFVRQHDLNRHIKGHIEARYSKCPCGKEFARLDALRKHQDRNICIGGNKGVVSKPKKVKSVASSPTKANLDSSDMVGRVDKQFMESGSPDDFLVLQ
ncbi:hypothetical protein G210_4803 [Candida maltosa Xu316]|uniref:C2H2-type domain-containing protein n=1 Tax=Candida maltosa (strain Xu316) TaxID=1245528 RepID=M3K4I3_CANMX|nr:hypothetical protein G210_4803 [Candida maltosa Xu316]